MSVGANREKDVSSKAIRVLRKREAMTKLGMRESSFDDVRRKDRSFPTAIALGAKAIGFLEHELDAWIETRPRVRTCSVGQESDVDVEQS